MSRQTDRWTDEQTDRQRDGQTNRRTDEQTGRRTVGQMDTLLKSYSKNGRPNSGHWYRRKDLLTNKRHTNRCILQVFFFNYMILKCVHEYVFNWWVEKNNPGHLHVSWNFMNFHVDVYVNEIILTLRKIYSFGFLW